MGVVGISGDVPGEADVVEPCRECAVVDMLDVRRRKGTARVRYVWNIVGGEPDMPLAVHMPGMFMMSSAVEAEAAVDISIFCAQSR